MSQQVSLAEPASYCSEGIPGIYVMNSRNYDLIVFDWDGTLMDSASSIMAAIRHAANDAGLPQPLQGEARYVIGLGLHEAIRTLFPHISAQQFTILVKRFQHHYMQCNQGVSLFQGVAEMIGELYARDFLLVIATGNSRKGLDHALDSSGMRDYFHSSRCADETFSKPHPAMLTELMEQFDVEAGRTLLVGDTTHDLQMAVNAGVSKVGVTYGAHPREKLSALTPLACVDSVPELRIWLDLNG